MDSDEQVGKSQRGSEKRRNKLQKKHLNDRNLHRFYYPRLDEDYRPIFFLDLEICAFVPSLLCH
jgi:hypothetical protein